MPGNFLGGCRGCPVACGETMEARRLSDDDARAYLSLRVQAVKEDRPVLTPELQHELATFAGNPSRAIAAHSNEGTCLWGVYDRQALAGVVAVSHRFTVQALSHLWLWGLYVRSAYRGTPVSRVLMQATLEWCEGEPPGHRLFAAYDEGNYRARQFFERWDFHAPGDGLRSLGPTAPLAGQVLVERGRGGGDGTDA